MLSRPVAGSFVCFGALLLVLALLFAVPGELHAGYGPLALVFLVVGALTVAAGIRGLRPSPAGQPAATPLLVRHAHWSFVAFLFFLDLVAFLVVMDQWNVEVPMGDRISPVATIGLFGTLALVCALQLIHAVVRRLQRRFEKRGS